MDEALYRAVYHSDPDDETVATFYGMLNRIPHAIRVLWRGESTFESRADAMVDNMEKMRWLEEISD